ncbi:hypothetical protein IT774_05175 [Salinimonas marina]|uniref:DUF6950 domain-containing protein n=1 Tax=Salinimonas marina TaxID=2785918 RepID=A0A7S9DZ20_9ALTE|nr:hypothetical protein [Salinimonas marina]QPG06566.1 hypothetical protein IT774_05175 [Salinimonas marina]
MRKINWATALTRLILDNMDRPFEWGKFDCCLFAADAVQLITGQDYAAPFRGTYTTQLGAARSLKRYGAGTIQATLNAQLGPPHEVGYLSDGDLCLVETDQGDTAAIFQSNAIWTPGPTGLLPIHTPPKAVWRL